MRVVVHPAPVSLAGRVPVASRSRIAVLLGPLVGACLLIALIGGTRHSSPRVMSARPGVTSPRSWLKDATLLTAYGRGFGIAPILGRLGTYSGPDDLARQLEPARRSIVARTGGKSVRLAIHLIYALATPCDAYRACLLYFDDTGVDLVKQYIEPAARRGWLVILDDQLGRSTPQAEMRRIARRGYLAYDNVEVAFDPEFRTSVDQMTPGVPTGYVTAAEMNAAQMTMQRVGRRRHLPHRKLMLVHQWTSSMIRNRWRVRTDLSYVQPVVVMDGIGPPDEKAGVYHSLLGSAGKGHLLTGIKLFPPNPFDPSGHWDYPVLSWKQLVGRAPVRDLQGGSSFLRPRPRVIVLT